MYYFYSEYFIIKIFSYKNTIKYSIKNLDYIIFISYICRTKMKQITIRIIPL